MLRLARAEHKVWRGGDQGQGVCPAARDLADRLRVRPQPARCYIAQKMQLVEMRANSPRAIDVAMPASKDFGTRRGATSRKSRFQSIFCFQKSGVGRRLDDAGRSCRAVQRSAADRVGLVEVFRHLRTHFELLEQQVRSAVEFGALATLQ